jgi:hypothetical protein
MRWKEACYGGTDVMERSCAVARGKDFNSIIAVAASGRLLCVPLTRRFPAVGPCVCGPSSWPLGPRGAALAVVLPCSIVPGVGCPTTPLYLSGQPKPPSIIWLAIYC